MLEEEIALRIFCAMLQSGSLVSVRDSIAKQEIETAFAMAETFAAVHDERTRARIRSYQPVKKETR